MTRSNRTMAVTDLLHSVRLRVWILLRVFPLNLRSMHGLMSWGCDRLTSAQEVSWSWHLVWALHALAPLIVRLPWYHVFTMGFSSALSHVFWWMWVPVMFTLRQAMCVPFLQSFTEKHEQRKERILREGFLGEGCLLATLHEGFGEDYRTAKCDSTCKIEGLVRGMLPHSCMNIMCLGVSNCGVKWLL